MTGIENFRESYARMQAQRLSQPLNAPIQTTQLNNLSYANILTNPIQYAPVLQNTNGTFVAQPLYDR